MNPGTPDGQAPDTAPLVLTLRLADPTQSRFEALRVRHFPPGRNKVPAHATLFHALPADATDTVAEALAPFGSARFPVRVTGVRSLGRGVAFTLESAALAERRAAVARRLAGRLTRQDAAPWRPHVTVQNKVTAADAASLLAALSRTFEPFDAQAAALHLWAYRGGPWEHVLTVPLG